MSGFRQQPKGFASKAIHAGQDSEQWSHSSVVAPMVPSTTFKLASPFPPTQKDNLPHYAHGRSDNPTRHVLEQCLAALDNAKYALTFSSGTGAFTTIFQMLSSGDHIVAFKDIYTGTYEVLTEVTSRHGIQVDFIDGTDMENVRNAIKSNTKMLWMESPTNPCLKIMDIEAIARVAHAHPNVIVVVDNTFLTPYFQRPLELGADIVMYSLTKYMNGHSDVFMGSVATNNDELYEKLKRLQCAAGNIPSPFDCYQVNRGLKTLAVRMEQHSKNSLAVAKYLESHPNVERVLHPALPSHPQHELAMKQSYGHSGMLSFYLKGGLDQSSKFVQNVKFIRLAASLGGVETLVGLPIIMSHHAVPEEERIKMGVTASLIRLSVGLEDVDDLIDDLEQALQTIDD